MRYSVSQASIPSFSADSVSSGRWADPGGHGGGEAMMVVVVAEVGEGRGPEWHLSGSGRLSGVVGRYDHKRLPSISTYRISSSGLHSESPGMGDDCTASGVR